MSVATRRSLSPSRPPPRPSRRFPRKCRRGPRAPASARRACISSRAVTHRSSCSRSPRRSWRAVIIRRIVASRIDRYARPRAAISSMGVAGSRSSSAETVSPPRGASRCRARAATWSPASSPDAAGFGSVASSPRASASRSSSAARCCWRSPTGHRARNSAPWDSRCRSKTYRRTIRPAPPCSSPVWPCWSVASSCTCSGGPSSSSRSAASVSVGRCCAQAGPRRWRPSLVCGRPGGSAGWRADRGPTRRG